MIRDMDGLGFSDTADELVISRDELKDIFREYCTKIDKVIQLIVDYHKLFGEKHSAYINSSRIRQKAQTRLSKKTKQNQSLY